MQHIARRVKGLMDSQANALKSGKVANYHRIARWMPYQTPIYFQSLLEMFGSETEKAKNQLQQAESMAEVPLCRGDLFNQLKEASDEQGVQDTDPNASNILNWPNNRLMRKTSINDLLLMEKEEDVMMKSSSNSSLKMGVLNVSQAFRKSDKFTNATLMRVNPVLAF